MNFYDPFIKLTREKKRELIVVIQNECERESGHRKKPRNFDIKTEICIWWTAIAEAVLTKVVTITKILNNRCNYSAVAPRPKTEYNFQRFTFSMDFEMSTVIIFESLFHREFKFRFSYSVLPRNEEVIIRTATQKQVFNKCLLLLKENSFLKRDLISILPFLFLVGNLFRVTLRCIAFSIEVQA